MMSGIQGIIVCGEASESEEEEEFCIVQAQGQQANEAQKNSHPIRENWQENNEGKLQHAFQYPFQQKKATTSLLHQKLWETNISLEKNLCKALQEPLIKKTSHMATLISSVPSVQTSTLSANAAFSSVSQNLSHIDLLLQGLNQIDAFDTLKSHPSCSF